MKNLLTVQPGNAKCSFAALIGSHLLGLSVGTVRAVWLRVRENAWQPQKPTEPPRKTQVTAGGLSPTQATLSHLDARHRCLCNMVRLALSTGLEGGSQNQYIRQLQRMALAGAHVDTTCWRRDFPATVVALASLVLQQLDTADYNGLLPGLGIASDFSILIDPVSIGIGVCARHDVLLVICLCIASPTGVLHTPLHSSPAMPFGSHSGESMVDLLMSALAGHPAACG